MIVVRCCVARGRCAKVRGKGGSLLAEATAVHRRSTEVPSRGKVVTPALVYDRGRLSELADVARRIRDQSGAKVLYAVKACAFSDVLQTLAPSLDGFAVSSLFEARLIQDRRPNSMLHLTTPGLRPHEIDELADLCSFVAFNSETQLHHFGPTVHQHASVGIRVNTHISHVEDPRYNPAQRRSQLGVPLESLTEILKSSPVVVSGLHFHTNADSEDLSQLEANVEALADAVASTRRFDWVNFGGGYLFENVREFAPLERSVELAKRAIADEVFVEPGAALVRSSAHLVASVVDMFERDGTRIAVLDTSVNHLPEVLEFGYQPEVTESNQSGNYRYIIAGSSCLSGDVFGEYSFDAPLSIGMTVSFTEAGAYAQAKSHRFNGINVPSVWITAPGGDLTERQNLKYTSYLEHWIPNA